MPLITFLKVNLLNNQVFNNNLHFPKRDLDKQRIHTMANSGNSSAVMRVALASAEGVPTLNPE